MRSGAPGTGRENTLDTRLSIASGTKGRTALTVMRLVDNGLLRLETRARSLLGKDLPQVDNRGRIEHLLAHRAGIGDYLNEETGSSPVAYVLPVPVRLLSETSDYLAVLDGHPQIFDHARQCPDRGRPVKGLTCTIFF